LPALENRQFFHKRLDVVKEAFVTCTEVVQSLLSIRGSTEPVPGALAIAHGQELALPAVMGQTVRFNSSEGDQVRALQQSHKGGFPDIPKIMSGVYKMIAAKEVTVTFHDGNIAAGSPKETEFVLLPESGLRCFLKELYFDPADIPIPPLIKYGAEKPAERLRRNAGGARAILRVRLTIDQGQKSNISSPDLLEKPINLFGVLHIVGIDHA
jgi:hypothetical protein